MGPDAWRSVLYSKNYLRDLRNAVQIRSGPATVTVMTQQARFKSLQPLRLLP